METTFTAIDFETANGKRSSICQVGLVRYENGTITKEINLLVQPPNNFYWDRFVEIHGISPRHTAKSPTFEQIWHTIEPYIKEQTVVAHNGMSFDFPVLKETLAYYDIYVPDYEKVCTYKIFKKNLALLSQQYKIQLNHHDALSDARACGKLYKIHLETLMSKS